LNEFVIEWTKGSKHVGVTAPSGTALKSKLFNLAERNPDEVKIIAENNDGSVLAHVPVSYIKISPPKKVSDEQREAAGERFRQMWKEKQMIDKTGG
jgi:hypothetical protein